MSSNDSMWRSIFNAEKSTANTIDNVTQQAPRPEPYAQHIHSSRIDVEAHALSAAMPEGPNGSVVSPTSTKGY